MSSTSTTAAPALLLCLGVLLGTLALPALGCERHLDGHQNGSDTAREMLDGR